MASVVIIENSLDELSDTENLLKSCNDIQVIARYNLEQSSLNDFAAIQSNVILLADNQNLQTTIDRVANLASGSKAGILVVGERNKDAEIVAMLEAGANGYLNQNWIGHYIKKAVQCIHAGEAWVTRKQTALVLEKLRLSTGNEFNGKNRIEN